MIREIVLDTETTGFDPSTGDRVVEIGCVELVNHVPTGNTYHQYINPERPMSEGAFAVHGLGDDFLSQQPVFAAIVDAFVEFVAAAPLVIHNAAFDIRFLDFELERCGRQPFGIDRAVDTLELARRRFPGAPASLDALCKRFEVDASTRTKHGALIDCDLLAEVYLHLIGGRQPGFAFAAAKAATEAVERAPRPVRPARAHSPTPDELAAHRAFVATLNDPLWRLDG